MAVMQGYCAQVSDTEVIAQLMAKNQTVMSILGSRQASLQLVSSFWARGDVRGALAALLQSSGYTSVACWNHSWHSQSMAILFAEKTCTAKPDFTVQHKLELWQQLLVSCLVLQCCYRVLLSCVHANHQQATPDSFCI